jgi:hypothetical protein
MVMASYEKFEPRRLVRTQEFSRKSPASTMLDCDKLMVLDNRNTETDKQTETCFDKSI